MLLVYHGYTLRDKTAHVTCIIYNNVFTGWKLYSIIFSSASTSTGRAAKAGRYVCAYTTRYASVFLECDPVWRLFWPMPTLLHDNNSTKLSRRCTSSTDTRRQIPSIMFKHVQGVLVLNLFLSLAFVYYCVV